MNKSNDKTSNKCKCPYCDEELKFSCFEPAFCVPCKVEIVICEKCGQSINAAQKSAHKCKENK